MTKVGFISHDPRGREVQLYTNSGYIRRYDEKAPKPANPIIFEQTDYETFITMGANKKCIAFQEWKVERTPYDILWRVGSFKSRPATIATVTTHWRAGSSALYDSKQLELRIYKNGNTVVLAKNAAGQMEAIVGKSAIPVQTEEELESLAKHCTRKQATLYRQIFELRQNTVVGEAYEKRIIERPKCAVSPTRYFSKLLQEKVTNFFGEKITTVEDILEKVSTPVNNGSQKYRGAEIAAIAEKLGIDDKINDGLTTDCPTKIIMGRDGDKIGIFIADKHWYNWGNESFQLTVSTLIINTAKKTFLSGYKDIHSPDGWRIIIPSGDNLSGFSFTPSHTYDFQKRQYETKKLSFVVVGDIEDIVHNTPLQWLIDKGYGDIKLDTDFYSKCREIKTLKPASIKGILEEPSSPLMLKMLMSIRTPWSEKLIKADLPYLYLATLCDPGWFHKPREGYYSYASGVTYNAKASGLAKAVGLSMKQLRMLEDRVKEALGSPVSVASGYAHLDAWKKRVDVDRIVKNIDTGNGLASMDTTSFNKLLDYSSQEWEYLRRRDDNTDKKSPQEAIRYLDKLRTLYHIDTDHSYDLQSCWHDYCRMRQRVGVIRNANVDIPNLNFNHYPEFPDETSRFVPYHQGSYGLSRTCYDTNAFIQDLLSFDPHATFEIDPVSKEFYGGTVRLTALQNLHCLHDELAYWNNFLRDRANAELFKTAIERVAPLAYTSEKYGLSIVVPNDQDDIRREGMALSHCVGSYVDSIVKGYTNILFIRRNDMLDTPYYTMEVTPDGKIRQVHCYRNGDLTSASQTHAYSDTQREVYNKVFDIYNFLQEWAEVTKKTGIGGKAANKINTETITMHYGALCAPRG